MSCKKFSQYNLYPLAAMSFLYICFADTNFIINITGVLRTLHLACFSRRASQIRVVFFSVGCCSRLLFSLFWSWRVVKGPALRSEPPCMFSRGLVHKPVQWLEESRNVWSEENDPVRHSENVWSDENDPVRHSGNSGRRKMIRSDIPGMSGRIKMIRSDMLGMSGRMKMIRSDMLGFLLG